MLNTEPQPTSINITIKCVCGLGTEYIEYHHRLHPCDVKCRKIEFGASLCWMFADGIRFRFGFLV